MVLAASAVLTILIQPETRWETFADQSLASLGYYQNWELANTASNYLRAGEAVSPLQHIWSMSVQGQFYIAFLALIFGFAVAVPPAPRQAHCGPRSSSLLSALTIASFVYAIIAHDADQATAYYNSFARGWELLLGALVGALVPLRPLADVAAHDGRGRRARRDPVLRRADRRRQGVPRAVGAGARRRHDAVHPQRRQPDGRPAHRRPTTAAAATDCWRPKPFVSLGVDGLLAVPVALAAADLLAGLHRRHARRTSSTGAVVLLVSGVLAWLTTKYVEDPLRYARRRPPRPVGHVLRCARRLRRPTIVLGSIVTLLGVALTATSFTWREHMTVQRANGKELSGPLVARLPRRARADQQRQGAQAADAPHRARGQGRPPGAPPTHGCISDFDNVDVINCTYGDKSATRTIALAGGSHAEHWITALDLLGRMHHFKVVTYLKMGCPLTTEENPAGDGRQPALPEVPRVEREGDAEAASPTTPTTCSPPSTRPWNIKDGDVMPGFYVGIWQELSRRQHSRSWRCATPRGWCATASRSSPPTVWPTAATPSPAASSAPRYCPTTTPLWTIVARFPMLKPLDMSDAVCRQDYCRAVEGNVLIYHDSHHISTTYMRTMTNELGRQIAAATGWW